MAGQRIEVQVLSAFRKELPVPWLRRIAKEALTAGIAAAAGEGGRSPGYRSLSLVIADDDTVKGLNRDYRGLDEATDVLAFSSDYPGEYQGEGEPPSQGDDEPFVTPPEDDGFAGEVIVSYPQCLRQAAEHGHSAAQEMALLITHGVLHLLGYDHGTPQDEGVMKPLEVKILAKLGFAGPHP